MKRFYYFWVATLLLAAQSAGAQPADLGIQNPIKKGLDPAGGLNGLNVVIGGLVRNLMGVVGLIALCIFMWAGWNWLTSAGNSDKVDSAKETIKWAAIGLLIIFGSYLILSAIFGVIRPATMK